MVGPVLVLVVTAAVVFLARDGDPAREAAPAAPDPRPPVTTQLGVFVGAEPERVHAFEDWLGQDVAYVVDFFSRQTWSDIAQPQSHIDTWKDQPFRKVYSVRNRPRFRPAPTPVAACSAPRRISPESY